MAISINQTTSGIATTTGTTLSTTAINQPAGHLIVACVKTQSSPGTIAVTDTAGNTFTPQLAYDAGANTQLQFWFAANCLGNAANVTTFTNATTGSFRALFVWDLAGALLTSPADGTARGDSFPATTFTTNVLALTTTNANDIILVAAAQSNVNGNWTPEAGFTIDGSFSTVACGFSHAIVSSIQTGAVISQTSSLSSNGIIFASAFQPAIVIGGGNSSWLSVGLNNGLRGVRH